MTFAVVIKLGFRVRLFEELIEVFTEVEVVEYREFFGREHEALICLGGAVTPQHQVADKFRPTTVLTEAFDVFSIELSVGAAAYPHGLGQPKRLAIGLEDRVLFLA